MNSINLTHEQQLASDRLIEFIFGSERCIILQGHAGTGKTTIINHVVKSAFSSAKLMESLDDSQLPLNVYFTAMTHKAKHALQENTQHKVTTLHKLLKIVPNAAPVNRRMFSTMTNSVIIVDECSYIDYAVLEYIKQCLNDNPTLKFIFMGDNYQLTPVGLNHCPIFNQGYPVISLHTVMRQQNSPVIADACQKLRDAIASSQAPILPFDGVQIIRLDKKAWDKQTVNNFQAHINTKVIRYSNHQVKNTNGKLFKHFTKRRQLQVGDTVLNNSYYVHTHSAAFSTIKSTPYHSLQHHSTIYSDTELVIDSIIPTTHFSNHGEFQVNYIIAHDPHSDTSYELYAPVLGETNPKNEHTNRYLFADLRPAFACTVHKAQGSTYDEVFINLNDFKASYQRSPKDTFRLLYVAFSRAKHKVYVTGDIV